MDLSILKSNDTCVVNLRHPATNEPIGLTVTIYGADSRQFKAEQHKIRNERLKIDGKVTSEQSDRFALELILNITTGWSGDWIFSGEQLQFSRPNLERVLREIPAFREQIDRAIGDRSNFLEALPVK